MKKYWCVLLSMLFITLLSFAQPGKKTAAKEKAPTQKEMEDMMKQAQKALDEMNPADKKMMDSLGIKMPSFKNAPKVTDKQLADAWNIENQIVPKKNAAKIAAISKTALSAGSVSGFVNEVNNKTLQLLWPESKLLAKKIYTQLKSTGKNSAAIGNAAAGLWMMGRLQPALYIMGKICTEDVSNTDNLSNYASMISMCGMQESAIPMLNYLNTIYPKNSTILNNLGQAWFGLGDMAKAEKYLDSTIQIYAYHPQANLTKSMIEEGKGNKTEAINLVKKSLKNSYSKEKDERLKKLGYTLTGDEVDLPPKTKGDGLNLGAFQSPSFPKSVDDCLSLQPVWTAYRQSLRDAGEKLGPLAKDQLLTAYEMQKKRNSNDLIIVQASLAGNTTDGIFNEEPLYAAQARLKLREVVHEFDRKKEELNKKIVAFLKGRSLQLKNKYESTMDELRKADNDQTGEGLPNVDFCPRYKEASDNFLSAYNSELEMFYKQQLTIAKSYLNDVAYWEMYTEWPQMFEALKTQHKLEWLSYLDPKTPLDFEMITVYKCAKKTAGKPAPLAQFDDVACQYHSELNLVLGKIKSDCSKTSTEIEAGFIKLGLTQNMDEKTFADQFVDCNVEAGAQIGKEIKIGPVTIGASATGRIGVTIDRNGVSDAYTIGSISAGGGIGPVSVDAGVEGRISIISGAGSVYGTGIFQK
ncbi:MAG: hypothetical protein ABIP30_00690 [Ferruginibacter sp.]